MPQEIILDSFQGLRNVKAVLHKGKPMNEPKKSWKQLCECGHNIGNNYNSHYLTIYTNTQHNFIYEIYRDGCFYPYYGNIHINNHTGFFSHHNNF